MRVPLIATLEYSVPETNPFPALDGVGRIPFSDKDGEPKVLPLSRTFLI